MSRNNLHLRARGPSGAEVAALLVSNFSTISSSCAVYCKEEADRGGYISLWCKITSCYKFFVRLSNLHVFFTFASQFVDILT